MENKITLNKQDSDVVRGFETPIRKSGIVAFVTLAVQQQKDDSKMHIRQIYCPQTSNDYSNQMSTDRENEVLSYLENLQSICYPEYKKSRSIAIKTTILAKSSSISPSKKSQQVQIDNEALEELKWSQIGHYTITTCLGIKRYASFLNCFEPIQQSTPQQLNQGFLTQDYCLFPFSYVIVQDEPAFKFAHQILRGLFETSLMPYYQMLCFNDFSALKSQQAQLALIQPLKIDFIICYMFKIINRSIEDCYIKGLADFRDNGNTVIYEDYLTIPDSELFCPPNVSFKYLCQRISLKNIIQILNCLLLQKKVILISRDPSQNALIIEAFLELLRPLNKTIFMNISQLKQEMIDYIDSPVPYIIGISESVWNKVFMRKWSEASDDTVYFVIDTALLTSKTDLPCSPEPMTSILTQTLTEVFARFQSLNSRHFKVFFKQAVFNYILLIINDFRLFKIHQKDAETIADKYSSSQSLPLTNSSSNQHAYDQIIGLRQLFNFDSYLESQLPENYDFYQIFIETQLFNDFLERVFRSDQDKSTTYFINCIEVLQIKQSFEELINFQQELIISIITTTQQTQIKYGFHDILESYERALGQDRSVYLKTITSNINNDNGIFMFNHANIDLNLLNEIQKQSYIKSLIKRPITTRKIKPSKKSEVNLNKQNILGSQQIESRNQSSSIKEIQQIVSSVYFPKGPQKVSTPKGLPSEIKSMANFLSEDDSKSTNSKDMRNSQEEAKSDTSSIKSFFKFTFEKIQNKLKSSKIEAQNQKSSLETPQKHNSLLFDVARLQIKNLTGLNQPRNTESKNLSAMYQANSESFKLQSQQKSKSIFSTAFGPKSGMNYGRPKCYSETTASQLKGALPQQLPSNVHYQVDSQNLDARPSAISTSNKSYLDSPKSSSFTYDSLGPSTKARTEIAAKSSMSQGGFNNAVSFQKTTQESMFRTNQREPNTSQFSLNLQGGSGQKQSQQQLAYPIFNSGVVILKDVNKNTKRLVKKFNINLDLEDEKNKKLQQRQLLFQQQQQQLQQQQQQQQLPSITQSQSNPQISMSGSANQLKTLNTSRSGGTANFVKSSFNGHESPTDLIFNMAQKSSEKKQKNTTYKQQITISSGGKPPYSGRQKAISQNQPTQPSEQKKTPQITAIQQVQSLKLTAQKNNKNQSKIKRDNEVNRSQNIGQSLSMKKNFEKGIQQHAVSSRQEKLQTSMVPIIQQNQDYHHHSTNQVQSSAIKKSNFSNTKQSDSTMKHHNMNETDEGIEGVQSRIRSISYQMNQTDFQASLKYQIHKDKSQKILGHNASPNFQKDIIQSSASTAKQSQSQAKLVDQFLYLNSKSQLQTFNEYSNYDQQQQQDLQLIDSSYQEDSQVETPKITIDSFKHQNFMQILNGTSNGAGRPILSEQINEIDDENSRIF